MQYTQTIRSIQAFERSFGIVGENEKKNIHIPISSYLVHSFLWHRIRRFSPIVFYLPRTLPPTWLRCSSVRCKSVHCAYRIYLNVQSFSYRIQPHSIQLLRTQQNDNSNSNEICSTFDTTTIIRPTGWWMVKSTFAFRNEIRNQTWFYDLFIIFTAVVHSQGTGHSVYW